MEQLERNEKIVKVTFLIDEKMSKDIEALMKDKNWKRSAFIRFAIQKELDELKRNK